MSQASVSKADRRLLLGLAAGALLLIALTSVLAPASAANDPRPSSYNPGPSGAQAAYLTLQALGRPVERWEGPLRDLPIAEAPQTTLVLAEPQFSGLDQPALEAAVRSFLEHGGRVLTTGSRGATLLPGGTVAPSLRLGSLCHTEPDGPGPLAQAGHVEMEEAERWAAEMPAVRVEQRCGAEAVAVRLPYGSGEAVWWSSASPLSNAELGKEADLHLLLASLGEGRRVVFDEAVQQPVRSQWSATIGLPLRALLAQAALLFALLIFSFSRRHGPVRPPVAVPRSSPLEFARSMGDLYRRGQAATAAVEATTRRLQRVLVREGGLPQALVTSHPESVGRALRDRLGSDAWLEVGTHLQAATAAESTAISPRHALALVRTLALDAQQITESTHRQ